MDAVLFVREYQRMCDAEYKKGDTWCRSCPLFPVRVRLSQPIMCKDLILDHIEDFAPIVEQWSKEHPVQTNEEMFKEVFGSLIGIFVYSRGEYGCFIPQNWWGEPYEAPKED